MGLIKRRWSVVVVLVVVEEVEEEKEKGENDVDIFRELKVKNIMQ